MYAGFMLWAMLVAGGPTIKIDSVFQLGYERNGVYIPNPHWLYRVIRGKDTSVWLQKKPK